MSDLKHSPSRATDGDVEQRLLALLGRAEHPEEAGQTRLIVVPGQVELGGLQTFLRLRHL